MTDINERLDRMETTIHEIRETIAEARGSFKAGFWFIGALNVLVLPAVMWLFASTIATREENVGQNVKLQELKATCDEHPKSSNLFKTPASPSQDRAKNDEAQAVKSSLVAWRREDW